MTLNRYRRFQVLKIMLKKLKPIMMKLKYQSGKRKRKLKTNQSGGKRVSWKPL